jgi:preprotein translocase subunit SecD
MTNRLLLIAAALLMAACATTTHEAQQYRNLEMRLVSETSGTPFQVWHDSGTLSLDSDILFSGQDFNGVATSFGGDDKKTPSLNLHFTPLASKRFTAVTTQNTGRRLAVLINHQVVFAPKILHPITTGRFEITGPTDAEITEMYRSLLTSPR